MNDDETRQKVLEIMRGDRFCMVTSVGPQGRLHSHPMTPQEVTDAGDVWFLLEADSEQAANITAEKRVNLAFSDGSSWLSIAGHGSVRRDQGKISELWNPVVEAWFPQGPESPDVTLLQVESDSAEYWESPGGGRVASVLAFAKSKITGQQPSGESGSVDLR